MPAKVNKKRIECYRCDGTGKTCNICGESPNACGCDESDVFDHQERNGGDHYGECEDCEGKGK